MPRCPICSYEKHSEIGDNPDFPDSKVLNCGSCGFMWTYPGPSQLFLDQVYSKQYRRETDSWKPTQKFLTNMGCRAAAQKSFIQEYANVKLHGARVLDVGCGLGSLLNEFAGLANGLTGFEPGARMLALARSYLPSDAQLYAEMFTPGKFQENIFDLVIASHVLEHVAEPISFLSELFRIVRRDGGVVFLEVPHETRQSVEEIVNAKHTGAMHLLFFDPDTLKEAILKAGGSVIYMSTFGPDRRLYSTVDPRKGPWTKLVRWYVSRAIRRIFRLLGVEHLVYGPTVITQDDFTRETARNGIWIRTIAEKGSEPLDLDISTKVRA